MKQQIITTGNLAALDSAIDAVEQPKMMAVSKWWFDFWQADKRKRGRLIKQARRKMKLEERGIDTDIYCILEIRLKQNACNAV